jgi:ATP phosphoribosyltransferase
MRIATKYVTITRQHFARAGIAEYRIVESLGATEAAPASGVADIVVDITSTGSTLAANGLRVLEDGVMLKSQACLFAARAAVTENKRDAFIALFEQLGLHGRIPS